MWLWWIGNAVLLLAVVPVVLLLANRVIRPRAGDQALRRRHPRTRARARQESQAAARGGRHPRPGCPPPRGWPCATSARAGAAAVTESSL